jgi:hypothetical protein
MPKVKLNPAIISMEGTIGDLVFYREGDEVYSRRKGERIVKRSESQRAGNSRFGQASRWAKLQLLDPVIKAAYQRACHGHLTPHNIATGDFLHAPLIERIGLESYSGQPGGIIRITATDDFGVVRVNVQIRTVAGETVEEGTAERSLEAGSEEPSKPGAGVWLYASQVQVPVNTTLRIEATASDLPGNKATAKAFFYLE